ncbi:hypothetical protein K437DRAFT_73766 [Tilletiaria anomala UBC 951]|uniref:Secreted protein n=1 Tax=Tilletiaria anomala (strain ATCC 24038 / CBS 436.72 / UBC 951) TaxID=1037660 RepID=A0A066WGU5_TILAU|nr:uncharacterized protein K437DRAFT_73766 [Tilletiaria anomala UBC 951]KDN49920.1 hypothetical protein K437DRAFT_73766 [Tilletiaria anomala UBC 951]
MGVCSRTMPSLLWLPILAGSRDLLASRACSDYEASAEQRIKSLARCTKEELTKGFCPFNAHPKLSHADEAIDTMLFAWQEGAGRSKARAFDAAASNLASRCRALT